MQQIHDSFSQYIAFCQFQKNLNLKDIAGLSDRFQSVYCLSFRKQKHQTSS